MAGALVGSDEALSLGHMVTKSRIINKAEIFSKLM